jgi:hypothetical protein
MAYTDHVVARSGIRWLRDEGQVCRAGDVLGFCNVAVIPRQPSRLPLADEWRDLQVAFLAPTGGRLRKADVSRGGFLDRHPHHNRWEHDFSIGDLELRPGEIATAPSSEFMKLLFVAGRRATELADVRSGLLSGWHDRARMWRGDATGPFTTTLSAGICEQAGIFRGESDAFIELAGLLSPASHVVWTADHALVPSARVLLEQLNRTPDQQRAIEADAATAFAAASLPGAAWMYVGAMLASLARSPLQETYNLVTRAGIVPAGPPDTVVLSLNAELAFAFRHRRLGYTLTLHGFWLDDLDPTIKAWIQSDFEAVCRSVADITQDYYELIDTVRAQHPVRFIVLNSFSTSIGESIQNYSAFDLPLSDVVASVRAKELNLMLYDLARDRGVEVVDVDALVATLGAQHHLPDAVHQSGLVQRRLREQIARMI